MREYLAALDTALPAAPDEREPGPPKYTSPIDPQAAWSIKHGPGRFSYATNYLIDSETSVVLDVEATPARLGAEVAATRTLITRAADRFGFHPERLAAGKAYGSAGLLRWLFERGVEPHVPLLDRTALTQASYRVQLLPMTKPPTPIPAPRGTSFATEATSAEPARIAIADRRPPAARARKSRTAPTRRAGAC